MHTHEPIIGKRIKKDQIEELSPILRNDENLQAVFSGSIPGKLASLKTQWLVITNRRVIFYGRAFVGGGSDSFSYKEISSVEGARGVLLGSIHLNIHGKTEKFENMQKNEVYQALNIIRKNIEESVESKERSVDPLEQIRKLKELLDLGAISKEDYENKKKKLLESV